MRSWWSAAFLVLAVACGDDSATIPTAPGPSRQPDTAPSTLQIRGIVVEIGGGTVENATVTAKSCDESPSYNYTFGATVSDAGGGFRLSVDSGTQGPIGCVYLVLSKERYVTRTVNLEASSAGLTIELQPLRRVTGTVVEIDGGVVPGVQVSGERTATPVSTDAAGFFALADTAQSLFLEKQGYVRRYLVVPEGRDKNLGTVHIQRKIVLSPTVAVSTRLSAADVEYELFDMWDQGVFCSPCKWLDLETGGRDLDIELAWSGDTPLAVWVTADDYYASVVPLIARPGESSLGIAAPAASKVVLVGLRSDTFERKVRDIPSIPFTVRATVRD